jgi:Tc toxin complex TcA C-terminal TcB-binding domain
VSIPCVVGRYTSVNCTVTQSFSRVRKDAIAVNYADATHFHENFGGSQTLITSSRREDPGLFELNLRDERFLPFEGTGLISRFRISLPPDSNQFDLSTVSDFIFHFRYTSRSGGDALSTAAKAARPTTGMRFFDIRSEFSSEWYQFKNPPTGQSPALTLHFTDDHFPFHPVDQVVVIQSIEVLGAVDAHTAAQLALEVALAGKSNDYSLAVGSGPGGLRSQEKKFNKDIGDTVITAAAADAAALSQLLILCFAEACVRYFASPNVNSPGKPAHPAAPQEMRPFLQRTRPHVSVFA